MFLSFWCKRKCCFTFEMGILFYWFSLSVFETKYLLVLGTRLNTKNLIWKLWTKYFLSAPLSHSLNLQGEKVLSVCRPQGWLLFSPTDLWLALGVKTHGSAIHHNYDNGEQTSVWRIWPAPGRNNSLIWCWMVMYMIRPRKYDRGKQTSHSFHLTQLLPRGLLSR